MRHSRHQAVFLRRSILGLFTVVAITVLCLICAVPASAATGDFLIQGRGYGHGVGMSQWGAWEGAREGYTYNQILSFYYPGYSQYTIPATAIKVCISQDPADATWTDDHFYRVYLKPVVSTARLVLQNSGVADIVVPIKVGQVVEARYITVGGVGHIYVPGGTSYDQVYMLPDSTTTGRVAVSMQLTSTSTAAAYREYWGGMNVVPMSGYALYLNNWVNLDYYTRGVAEIKPEWAKPDWPQYYAIEAVKAQAVAARTYAYVEYLKQGVVNDDTRDICYKGYAYEVANPGAAQAAAATNGQVLKHSSGWQKTFFSSHSGGYTTATAWSDSPPSYVVSQPDQWSRVAPPPGLSSIQPGYAWTVTTSPATLATKLISPGYIDNVGTITKVEVIGHDSPDPESHATLLRITGTAGSDTISARTFKSALGLKSTLFSVVKDGTVTRVDDADLNIVYSGGWTRGANASAFQGSVVSVNGTGKASICFDGTYLAIIAKTAPYYGKARVTVDGGPAVTVDYYSPTDRFQQKVYNTGNLSPGEHRLVIEWTGTKNAVSWASLVGVDAVDVVGTLKPSTARHEQNDARLSYGGPWVVSSASGLSSGTQETLYAPGSVTVKFEGTYLAWITRKASYYGVARVTLDGKTSTTVDLYSPTEVYKAKVYSTGLLARGPHTLTIEWTGVKNPASAYHLIGVDAFDVAGSLMQAPAAPEYPSRYEQSEPRIAYLGGWVKVYDSSASGGSFTYALPGAQAVVHFSGTGLTWLATTGRWYDAATVVLDGGSAQRVNLYSPGTLYGQAVYSTGVIPDGDHTLTIIPDDGRSTLALSDAIGIDAFDIFGGLAAAGSSQLQGTDYPLVSEGLQSETTTTLAGPSAD